jgi:hypothetical protein
MHSNSMYVCVGHQIDSDMHTAQTYSVKFDCYRWVLHTCCFNLIVVTAMMNRVTLESNTLLYTIFLIVTQTVSDAIFHHYIHNCAVVICTVCVLGVHRLTL